MLRRLRRIGRLRPELWVLGSGPVLLILLIGAVRVIAHFGTPREGGVAVLALAISTLALLRRGHRPLPVLAAVLAIALASDYGPITTLSSLLALLTVAMVADRRTIVIATVATAVVIVFTPAVHDHALATAPPIVSRLVAVGLAVALGLYLRARSDYISGLRDRAERLERERELMAAQAVADERVRIARELHDVVAHNVSLMVVQAQALAATGEKDAEQLTALNRIAEIGREALSEMHRMLGVLRVEDGTGPEREPQPGVRDLDALIARTREAGVAASLRIEGRPRDLSPGVDLSAYRIAQEALTNVIRHAHAKTATVMLSYLPSRLELTVTDDGDGLQNGAGNGQAGGHGLVGMRERVALFGGDLEAGPAPHDRGYRVHASLPLT